MKRYNPSEIEPKWQEHWQQAGTYTVDLKDTSKPKYFGFAMLPYPSGSGLHTGHVRTYTLADVMVRAKRQQGFNAYNPIGWDAFGLPAENYAIKTGTSPKETTAKAVARFKEQLSRIGMSHDWSKEINTSDPSYYKWTQWIFAKLFEHGLAYQKESLQWWCDIDKTVLANEQVIGGKCWRHDGPNDPLVGKKALKQWFFKITDYADELLDTTDDLEWPDFIKTMQKNWIGRSKGAEITFATTGGQDISVFTTRPDTLPGATFMVVAPEHPLALDLATPKQKSAVEAYIQEASHKSDVERQEVSDKQKTGVFTGSYAINPVNDQKIPIWVADYALMGYGTGIVMGVSGHDQRDYDFAQAFKLPIVAVIEPVTGTPQQNPEFRRSIVAIVRNPKDHTFLSINWGKNGGNLFIGGGREDGENVVEAAQREIREETGYKTLRLVSQTGKIHHHYFAHSKGVARQIEAHGLLFDLVNDERDEPQLEADEANKFTVEWLPRAQIDSKVTDELHALVWGSLVRGECYHGEGIMVNAGPYNGMASSVVREKIVADLAEKGVAKWATNYKIRDWLISRQRYWGAPIPIVHCQHCRETIENKASPISFYSQTIWQKIMSGKKTVESRADNPDEPERRFANITTGDYLKFVNKANGDICWVRVREAKKYSTFKELFADKRALAAIFGGQDVPASEAELEAAYAALAPNYAEKIKQNGLVTWEFEKITPGVIAVPEDQLPVTLPEITDYKPEGGRSPLAKVDTWVNTTCPDCGGPAKRETDTMDGYACSSWYFLRYLDPHNAKQAWNPQIVNHWMPINTYNGADHAVSHLLYARFWTHFFHKLGLVANPEPVKRLVYNAYILAHDGTKMSKSKGNVVDPLEIVDSGYGADALRLYEMFIAPYDMEAPWDDKGVPGTYRFLRRTWDVVQKALALGETKSETNQELLKITHKTIKKVTQDIEAVKFNTAIAAMMEMVNYLYKLDFAKTNKQNVYFALESLTQLLAPFAPHIAEELWHLLDHTDSVHIGHWPTWDEALLVTETMRIVVQVNGKVRANVELPKNTPQADIEAVALAHERVKPYVAGPPKRIIYVPGKLVNLVV